ncbi:MAG: PDZ domain-containing protein [Myxococcales bacterium]|nr:PDZ domain-containing protein [Myxococcales bacterium]
MRLAPPTRPVIVLITLALCALFLARGTTLLLAARLERAPASPRGLATHTEPLPAPDVREILARNIFDLATGPLWPPPDIPPQPRIVAPVLHGRSSPPACDGGGRLLGGMHVETQPALSAVSLGEPGSALVYREGQRVGTREIVAIHRERVVLREHDGLLCTLRLFDRAATSAGGPRQRRAPSRQPPLGHATPPGAAVDEGEHSDTSLTISRRTLEALLADPRALTGLARVVPHVVDGEPAGLKLYGVRARSPLARVGLRNGDILHGVGDHDITDVDRALSAYASLREATELRVRIERRGVPQTLHYRIE